MLKRIISATLVVFILGGAFALYTMNKPHEDVSKLVAELTYTTTAMILEFEDDHKKADESFNQKVLLLSGSVTKLKVEDDQSILTFDDGQNYLIQAYLPSNGNDISKLSPGSSIQLKGRYSGYLINDEDFLIPADIKVEECYIQN